VPPSYLVLKQTDRKALYYYSEGELKMESEETSLDKFFELNRNLEVRRYRQPRFIHFLKDNVLLYGDEAEAREGLRDRISDFSLLQKYVASSTKYSKKVRVVWNVEKGFSYNLISNKNILPKTQWYSKQCGQKHENSSYMHSISKYSYAGRLLKTSLSPFNPYKSVLNTQSALTVPKAKINTIDQDNLKRQPSVNNCGFNQFLYLTKYSDVFNSITLNLHIKYLQLESTAKEFLKFVEKWRKRVSAAPINDVCFDFIEDSKGTWYLIGCKCKALKVDLLFQTLSLRRYGKNGTVRHMTEKRLEFVQRNEEDLLQKKINDFKHRLNSLSVSSPNVALPSTEFDNQFYTQFIHSQPISRASFRPKHQSGDLSVLVDLYDKTLISAKERKKEIHVQSELFEEFKKKINVVDVILNEIILGLSNNDNFNSNIKTVQNYIKKFF
jgi:hypothetical protein